MVSNIHIVWLRSDANCGRNSVLKFTNPYGHVLRKVSKCHDFFLILLDYVSRAHEIEICPSPAVRLSVRAWLLLPLGHTLGCFVSFFFFLFFFFLLLFFFFGGGMHFPIFSSAWLCQQLMKSKFVRRPSIHPSVDRQSASQLSLHLLRRFFFQSLVVSCIF